MRARLALVALTTVCGFFVLPATAHAAGGVLSCAGLTGTFTDTFDPIYDTEEIVAGHLSLRAEGTCLLDGKQVTASVTGEGRSIFGGVCGALAFGGNMDGQLPAVDPTESGTLGVTVTVTRSDGTAAQLTESWVIPATENMESVPFVVGGGQEGGGNVATRIFAHCSGDYRDQTWLVSGGSDKAMLTWSQSA